MPAMLRIHLSNEISQCLTHRRPGGHSAQAPGPVPSAAIPTRTPRSLARPPETSQEQGGGRQARFSPVRPGWGLFMFLP